MASVSSAPRQPIHDEVNTRELLIRRLEMASVSSAPRQPIHDEVNTRELLIFLMKLKLRSPRRRRLHVEMSRSEISPGDHLYTPRGGGVFDHHGIYIGEDRVIHFQNSLDDKALGSSIPRFGQCSTCGHHSGKSGVVKSCLDCFLRGGIIYRFEYGYRYRKRGLFIDIFMLIPKMGQCTSAASDPPLTVIDRAKLLHRDGFGEYNLLTNNCEHFALFCKTGKHIPSGQVTKLEIPAIVNPAFRLTASLFSTHFAGKNWKKRGTTVRISQPNSG